MAGSVGGVRGIGVEGGLEAQPHWAPVQGPAPYWQGCRGLHRGPAGCVGHQRASRGVGVSGGIWVAVGLEAQTHWAQVQGPSTPIGRGVGGSGHWVAGRECRAVRGHWGGGWTGSPTTLAPSSGSQHSIGRGVGGQGHWLDGRGFRGVRGDWGGRWTGRPTHIGPKSRVPALPLAGV